MTAPLLETRDLCFGYSARKFTIQQANLSIRPGTVNALIGGNGCGKSTLVRLLARILRPASGLVLFQGVPLDSIDARNRARSIAYVPQNTSNTFPFTALEVVLTGRSPHLQRYQFERTEDVIKARAALAALGIEHLQDRPMTQLSGGERQLVALARAMAQEAQCLLLDEPAASLDLKHRAAIMRLIMAERARAQTAAVIVTHDLMLIDSSVDTVFAMRDGHIVAAGPPAQILTAATLGDIYDDTAIQVKHLDGRTFVWS
jgi:iron complex transport system ATP-binding protein